eukprot:scpid69755/ scgid3796/ Heterogeneous nuclear ribonucleoprotein L
MSKRPWEPTDGASDFKRRKTGESHDTPPSKVVHVRNVADGTKEHDLTTAVKDFGKVSYVTLMPRNRQALVEFEQVESAIALVQYAKDQEVPLNGRPAFFNYSVSQTIKRAGNVGAAYQEYGPNKVLLFTVLNPMYPITVDVLHTIGQRHGEIQRIAIFHKNGVQALVEYASAEQAATAKVALDGADIYAGCCTLKIEFSKTDRVNVAFNNEESFDYTGAVPNTGRPSLAGGLGRGAPYGAAAAPGAYGGYGGFPAPGTAAGGALQPSPGQQFGAPQFDAYGAPTGQGQFGGAARFGATGAFAGDPGAVVMVYNLDPERINCERLFNLFCAYGNVVRIKVFVKKLGSALVQMDRREGASNAIRFLHDAEFMGQKLSLSFSHHAVIEDRGLVGQLADGTPAVVDFSHSRNNRFQSAEQSRKNLMIAPTKTLHFFNAPPDATMEDLKAVFTNAGAPCPINVTLFSKKPGQKEERSKQSGLMEWTTPTHALEAMAICNHVTLTPAGAAYTLKLAFSLSNSKAGGAAGGAGVNAMVAAAAIPGQILA